MSYSKEIQYTVESLSYKYKKKTNLLYVFILLTLIGVAIALPYVKIGISKQSRGVVRSATEDVDILSLRQGEVTLVAIANNQKVEQGEILMVIKPDAVNIQMETKVNLLEEVQQQWHDVNYLSQYSRYKTDSLVTPLYQKELQSFYKKEEEIKSKKYQASREYQRAKKMLEAGLLSQSDIEKSAFEFAQAKTALQSLRENQRVEWQSRLVQLQEQIENLQGDIRRLQEEINGYTVVAPIGGTIINYSGIKQHSFINGNQQIATISPDDNLIVECMVSPSDIGFITIDQQVNLQVDAFNYNQWGLGKAVVVDIDRNLTLNEQQAFFRVKCKLLKSDFSLKNGYQAKIKKGMTLTARFMVVERSLWDLLFDKVDDWFNPKTMSIPANS